MKPADNINNLFEKSKITVGPDIDKKILNKAMNSLPRKAAQPDKTIWSTMMHSKITKIAIAALLILGIYLLTLSDKGLPHAYAIQQTLEAMETVTSVHFKAELYKQGDIECWMLFDKPNEKPSHVCLFLPGFPIRKIDSPEGSFGYNEKTNHYRVNLRDEREANWYPDFTNFFKQSLENAQKNDNVTITEEFNDELQQQIILVNVEEGDRTCQYFIDPLTKLPIRFTTTETTDLKKWMQKTIAVKNISFIEYNLPEPEALFRIPEDAEEVTEEIDVRLLPGDGMEVGQLSREQACKQLIREFIDAVAQFEFEKAAKLYFPFRAPPPEIIAMMKQTQKEAGGKPLIELLETGKPVQNGVYWIVSCKIRELGGNIKNDPVRVRFFEFDNIEYCIIAMPD